MPRIDELLDQLREAQYFTTLDLTKGYGQIPPLSVKSKEKTAFATSSGLYQFVRMPFGLYGALAMFQHLTDQPWDPTWNTLQPTWMMLWCTVASGTTPGTKWPLS